jgi:glutathione S-transferase
MGDERVPAEGITLYQFRGCPFCSRVEAALETLGVDVEIRDTLTDEASADELFAATGRQTVPVLRIEQPDGSFRWMPESADIIDYLRARFG